MKRVIQSITLLLLSVAFVACGGNEGKKDNSSKKDESSTESKKEKEEVSFYKAEKGAKVFFANIKDGDTLTSPVKLVFGIEGMEVEPAGKLNKGKGHHHVVIDGSHIEMEKVVPADSVNIHYGKGQTEAEIELSPGKHSLTMQFADGYHQSYGKQMSATVEVFVKEEEQAEENM